ncbi:MULTISPECIES: allantoate amidohydrolase [unclassified Vibrio]|uniref:Allantoate amidohydrolase n=1 Tax=Vibrio sp. HB236076 TaxID=3232307 RepID=A0AB39HE40_9VIBR|nr:allantoate amidohydrolase [Vibrio sp. HB161653]MDP5252832.1 allantoate amidohydrolase [Vibrio sp. HB161653]
MTTMDSRAAVIMQQIETLAKISSLSSGVERVYLSEQHALANQQLMTWMQEAGLEAWQDSVGNVRGRKVSSQPTQKRLLIGSHSDTVTNAGKYDGTLGVLLAIEALAQLKDIDLPFDVDVLAFADEEGTRFNTTLIGSSGVAGCFDPKWLDIRDSQQISMAEAMLTFGLDPNKAGTDAYRPEDVGGYLEAHIEQGPVLEAQQSSVGVVSAIAGAKRYQFEVRGMAGHAGTVPMALRQDALCGFAEMVSVIEAFAIEHNIVATVGKCHVQGGAVNVIAGEVSFTLDIRSQSQAQLEGCCHSLIVKLEQLAQNRHLSLNHDLLYEASAAPCSDSLQTLWKQAVQRHLGVLPSTMPSGAGHDGLAIAKLTDIGMLFIRCDRGISHHPDENVNVGDVADALGCFIEAIKLAQLPAIAKV